GVDNVRSIGHKPAVDDINAEGRLSRSRSRPPATLRPKPCRLISRLTVEGDRSRPCAIRRIDRGGNAPRNLFALLKPQRYQSPPAWRWSNPSIASQDPIDAALVPPLKRSRDVRHTLTALPALPQLGLLFRREPCPCMPLHSHTSSSAKIRRCCVDSLNSPSILLQTPKLACDVFLAVSRSDRRTPICAASITLPRSPVSLSVGDEVPHIFTRKSRLQPGKFSISSAKRLLQHNWM